MIVIVYKEMKINERPNTRKWHEVDYFMYEILIKIADIYGVMNIALFYHLALGQRVDTQMQLDC